MVAETSLKVLFITQDDPIYTRAFFEELLASDWRDIDITGIVMAPPMGKQTVTALVAQMWNFYGPVDFVRMGLRFVGTKIMRCLPIFLLFGRRYSIAQLASAYGVPVNFVTSLNDSDFVESVKRREIDVLVSVAAPQIIKTPLINAPKLACINIHNGTLPRYRGMLPNFWQIFDGNKTVGTTIHRINEGIDDGAILLQDETELLPHESLDSVIRRTKRKGAPLVLKVLRQLRDGTVTEKENTKGDGSYFSFPTRQDVIEFRRRGHKLL